MNRSYKIKPIHATMRLDRWIKNNIGKYPQSLLEKSIRKGKIRLKIPEGTQTGKMFRMRSKGIKPVRGGPQGDLICRVVVETPIKLTASQKDLMKELEKSLITGEGRHSPNTRNWLDKVKGFLKDVGL